MNLGKKGYKYATVLFIFLIIILLTEKDAFARRYFFMGMPELKYRFSYEYQRDIRSDQGFESKKESETFSEGIKLKTKGWVYHPALLLYNFTLSPEWDQISGRSGDEKTESRNFLQGYFTELKFFQYKQYNINMFAGRSTIDITSNFASQSKRNMDRYGASLYFKYPVLPSGFNYFHTRIDQSGFFAFNEEKDSFDMQLSYDRHLGKSRFKASYEDTETTTQGNIVGNTEKKFNYNNKYDFNNNQTLSSDMDFKIIDADFTNSERYSVRENFLWDHRRNLKTRYNFGINGQESAGSKTESKNLGFNLTHLLYENLTTNIDALGRKNQYPGVKESYYGGRIKFNYLRRIPWGNLRMNTGHGYMINDQNVTSKDIEIIGESVTLTTGTSTFLSNQNVDIDSIVVRNETTLAPYDKDIHYTITEIGNYVRISRIQGVPGGISDGETVSVDYAYLSNPSFNSATLTSSYGISLNLWKVWNIFYRLNQKQERYLSGVSPDELIVDRIHSTGTDLTWRWSKTSLAYTDADTTSFPKEEWKVEEALTFKPMGTLFFSITGNYGEVRIKNLEEVENFRGYNASVQYLVSSAGRVTLRNFWNRASGAGEETITSGVSALFETAYRALRGSVEYTYSDEENVTSDERTRNNSIKFMLGTKGF
jgi:hypothetical protein